MNLQSRIENARATWRREAEPIKSQYFQLMAAKHDVDNHMLGVRATPSCAITYNHEWHAYRKLIRQRRRHVVIAFLRPGSS